MKKTNWVIWLTGLPGSGKTTIANALHEKLDNAFILDGDVVRNGLCSDLGFSPKDRLENVRRITEVAKLLQQAGVTVIVALISPYRGSREQARRTIGKGFLEVFVDASLEVCEERDPKGLYKKARSGELPNFTGIDAPYETPDAPDLTVYTDEVELSQCVDRILVSIGR